VPDSFSRLTFRLHATQRMFQRGISVDDVRQVVEGGNVVEDYPDDQPYPSCLLLGWCQARPIHVVCAHNRGEREIIIVTVYEPDPEKWDSTFTRRRA